MQCNLLGIDAGMLVYSSLSCNNVNVYMGGRHIAKLDIFCNFTFISYVIFLINFVYRNLFDLTVTHWNLIFFSLCLNQSNMFWYFSLGLNFWGCSLISSVSNCKSIMISILFSKIITSSLHCVSYFKLNTFMGVFFCKFSKCNKFKFSHIISH